MKTPARKLGASALILPLLLVGCRPPLWDETQPFLAKAGERHRRALDESVASMDRFFENLKDEPADAFVDKVMGFKGLWEAVTSSKEEFAKWVAGKFSETVLTPERLKKGMGDTSSILARGLEASSAQLRADLVALTSDYMAGAPDARGTTVQVGFTPPPLAPDSMTSVARWTAGQALAFAVDAIVSQALVRAGMLAAGGEFSFASLGISLIVFIIVDAIVSHYSSQKLKAKVAEGIDQIKQTILPGLRQALGEFVRTYEEKQTENVRNWLSTLSRRQS